MIALILRRLAVVAMLVIELGLVFGWGGLVEVREWSEVEYERQTEALQATGGA